MKGLAGMLIVVGCLALSVNSFALAEDDAWVSVLQEERPCRIRDFGESDTEGWLRGVRNWYGGGGLHLECSWYAGKELFTHPVRNIIHGGGMIYGEAYKLQYFGYNVAFFDADENLVACAGEGLGKQIGTKRGAMNLTRSMPIPKGGERGIVLAKVSFFESGQPIGQAEWKDEKTYTVEHTNGNTGEVTRKTYPKANTDGELRETPFQVRSGSRLLAGNSKNWQAETTEGKCTLQQADLYSLNQRDKICEIEVGSKLSTAVKVELALNANNAVAARYSYQTWSKQPIFGQIYVALFDEFGNLVGATQTQTPPQNGPEPPPKTTVTKLPNESTTFTVYSVPGSGTMNEIPLPKGLEKRIFSYQATLYESDAPVGSVPKAGGEAK